LKHFPNISEVKAFLKAHEGIGSGFVPTMGALHKGHLELVKRARRENVLATCSIFVNPIQFNNPEDLKKYPRTLEEDLRLLESAGCDMVFVPTVGEMYPEPVTKKYDFGLLEQVMEGKSRPGHFNGVAVVVKKLFEIMEPDKAYFGEKDYQQLRIIQALVGMESLPVQIVPCPTIREGDGLAMSSRNRRLTEAERRVAPEIFNALKAVKEQAGQVPAAELKQWASDRISGFGMVIDYFEIAEAETLQPVDEWKPGVPVRAFVACFLGNVRLIDNMEIISKFAG
jgi:pantoate--beta-alanine ligase